MINAFNKDDKIKLYPSDLQSCHLWLKMSYFQISCKVIMGHSKKNFHRWKFIIHAYYKLIIDSVIEISIKPQN